MSNHGPAPISSVVLEIKSSQKPHVPESPPCANRVVPSATRETLQQKRPKCREQQSFETWGNISNFYLLHNKCIHLKSFPKKHILSLPNLSLRCRHRIFFSQFLVQSHGCDDLGDTRSLPEASTVSGGPHRPTIFVGYPILLAIHHYH